MTTTLQFSVYDMCHCYNNLNSTHTLNMIVYFCPFGLQFELLQQTQMRWPSWFQDLESYQPMGGGLSLVQLTVVIWCSFACTKLTKPLHQTTCSTMLGHSWHWWLWLLRVRERSQLRWARRIQLEAGLQPRQPIHVPRAQLSDHPTNHRSYHRRWLLCYASSIREGGLCLHIIPWVSWITISRDSSTQLVAR